MQEQISEGAKKHSSPNAASWENILIAVKIIHPTHQAGKTRAL